jgi:hypothetical protein
MRATNEINRAAVLRRLLVPVLQHPPGLPLTVEAPLSLLRVETAPERLAWQRMNTAGLSARR